MVHRTGVPSIACTTFFTAHVMVESHACFCLSLRFIFFVHHFGFAVFTMPACIDEEFCKEHSLPLDGHHACALCHQELHGICGRFYNEDSIKFQNICFSC
jgi:hypothetical protein